MDVTVRLFAVARQAVGQPTVIVTVDQPATVGTLRRVLGAGWPALAPWLPSIRVAVDDEYADDSVELTERSEVALIPPVSGGCVGSSVPDETREPCDDRDH